MTMATKEEILRRHILGPFHYADGLTLGEAEVYKKLAVWLSYLRPVINEYWEKPQFSFDSVAKGAQIIRQSKLFEGREGSWKPSELYIAFLYLETCSFGS